MIRYFGESNKLRVNLLQIDEAIACLGTPILLKVVVAIMTFSLCFINTQEDNGHL